MTSRIIIFVSIVVALGLGWNLFLADTTVNLVTVESEREANAIQVALFEHDIRKSEKRPIKEKRATVWEIRVPADKELHGKRVLDGLGYPKVNHSGFSTMLANSALIPSRTDERARLMDAIAGELARTFESDDDIVTARVHVSVPPERLNLETDSSADRGTSASVFLQYRADVPTGRQEANASVGSDWDGVPISLVPMIAPVSAEEESSTGEGGDEDASKAVTRYALPGELPAFDALPIRPDAVCTMVANAVEDLAPDRVTVVYRRVEVPKTADDEIQGDGGLLGKIADPVFLLFLFAISMLGTTIWFFNKWRISADGGAKPESRPARRRTER